MVVLVPVVHVFAHWVSMAPSVKQEITVLLVIHAKMVADASQAQPISSAIAAILVSLEPLAVIQSSQIFVCLNHVKMEVNVP